MTNCAHINQLDDSSRKSKHGPIRILLYCYISQYNPGGYQYLVSKILTTPHLKIRIMPLISYIFSTRPTIGCMLQMGFP